MHDEEKAYNVLSLSDCPRVNALKNNSQLTTIPNNTPMTKSQAVITTIILAIVKYSDLMKEDYMREHQQNANKTCKPANTVSRIPQSFLDKIKTQYKDK
jgi:hypothetical protein